MYFQWYGIYIKKNNGFFSTFQFKCKMCGTKMCISSENKEAVLNGTVAIGKIYSN